MPIIWVRKKYTFTLKICVSLNICLMSQYIWDYKLERKGLQHLYMEVGTQLILHDVETVFVLENERWPENDKPTFNQAFS